MRSIVVGTAGHIDHGKSALVRALTGTDPDRLKEEKARGITIDLGFAHLQAGGVSFGFVDVPGHERFVRNMLAGAGGIDAVLLVIAADESVMPQTREHFQICRLLAVPSGLIVLTKCDVADADMREIARMEARELAAGSFLADAPIVEVSSKTGEGLDALRAALAALAAGVPARRDEGPVRLPVDRVFSVKGFGTVVTGTLVSGVIQADRDLVVLPRERAVKVRGMQVHGESAASAGPGRRLAVNLGGIEVADLARGDTLCTPGAFRPTRRVDVAVDLIEGTRPLKHGARVRFHQGTTELLGRVAIAGPRGGEGSASEVPAGASAYARLRLEGDAVLTRGDRFIIRAYSPPVTIGGGVVLDPHPVRGPIRTPGGRARFDRIQPAAGGLPDTAVSWFVEESRGYGLPSASLVDRAGLSTRGAAALVARLTSSGAAMALGDRLVRPAVVDDLAARLLAALAAHHKAEPLSDGLPREEARERIFGRAAPVVFDHVIGTLAAQGKIVARDRLALAGHRLSLSPEETAAQASVEQVYRDAGLLPPDAVTAAAAAGVTAPVADRVSRLLVRARVLVKLDTLLFHAEALARLKADVQSLKGTTAPARVDVAAFKERFGVSRKYAIPLLEYLDRERVTRRVGDARIVI